MLRGGGNSLSRRASRRLQGGGAHFGAVAPGTSGSTSRVAQIESMISEFERISSDLEREIKTEQDRSGIHDPGHFAYPTYAKAAIQRRDNLKRSANDLKIQLEDAKAALNEAFEEMKKVELLDEREQMRVRSEEDSQVGPETFDLMRSSARA